MGIYDYSKRAQQYLDKLWDDLDEDKRIYTEWRTRNQSYKDDLSSKEEQVKNVSEGILVKKDSIIAMSEVSKFYEEHSVRQEIENILCQVIGQLYNHSDMRYKFLKRYIKNQHEVSVWKIDKDLNEKEYLIPINNTSGGNRDIIDVIIRVLVIKQFNESQRILILDEPMKDLSKDLRESFFIFLKSLCESFKIQFILITHEDEYIGNVDRTLYFQKINTVTNVQVKD